MRLFLSLLLLSGSVLALDPGKPLSPGSKVYITPSNGFETYLAGAIANKHVPLVVVADKEKADYIIDASVDSQKPGWAKTIFLKQGGTDEEASVRLVDAKTSAIVWAYNVNKHNSVHGKQSTAEACAKHLKSFMEKGK